MPTTHKLTAQTDEQGQGKGNGTADRVTYSCGGCSVRWSGVSRAHCSACHETFAGAALFDTHRRDQRGVGTCLDPHGITVTSKDGAVRPAMHLVSGLWASVEELAPRLTPAQRAR